MPRDETAPHPDLPDLSNEDVAILYEIINVACQITNVQNLPFRAIFAAYDEVLAKHGISPAHDQLYLRFLFRLGERLSQDNDGEAKELFTEFESLLLELGIKIELGSADGFSITDEDLSSYAEDEENEPPKETNAFTDADSEEPFSATPRRTRRASFSEVLNIAEETSRAEREPPESPASISRLQDTSDGFGSRPYTRRQQRRASDDAFVQVTDTLQYHQGRITIQADAVKHRIEHHQNHDLPLRGSHSFASRGLRTSSRSVQSHLDFDIYEDSDRSSEFSQQRSVRKQNRDKEPIPSQAILVRLRKDADVFNSFRLQSLCRRLISTWHQRLKRKQHQRAQMLVLAVQYDRRELMKQAWLEWVEKHREKQQTLAIQRQEEENRRQTEEQEQYLQWREDNAAKARNTYLVAKAFSHWANCAAERVEENAAARRHLVHLRYFNAWKEITAVNDIKVRRLALKKFLAIWHRKLHANLLRGQQALILNDNSLLQTSYWNWFWRCLEQRAPAWRDSKLKQRYFLRWTIAAKEHVKRHLQASQNNRIALREQSFRNWSLEITKKKSWAAQADKLRRQKLTLKALNALKNAAKLAAPARHVAGMVDWRIASTSFTALVQRFKTEQQAEQINQRRLLRNIWTAWNDELRVRTLQHQVNDRLVMQALYKWVLAERGSLMRRLHQERLQEQVFDKLIVHQIKIRGRLVEVERQANENRKARLSKAVLAKWKLKKAEHAEQKNQALAMLTPRMTSRVMHRWHAEHQHQAELERWSVEAAFFLRGKRSLKKWSLAAKESQKQKRRDAYAEVRHTYNANIAKSALRLWVERYRAIEELQIEEHNFHVLRTQTLLTDILRRWSRCTRQQLDRAHEAVAYDQGKLITGIVVNWITTTRTSIANCEMAEAFFATRVEKTAYDALRRLQLKTLEVQSHNAKANSVLAWNSRRRARGLLRAWADRAASRRSDILKPRDQRLDASDSGPLLPHGVSLISLARTPRMNRRGQSILPEIPPQIPFPTFTTPMPTYLSTPSNRAARAKALAQASTPYLSHTTRANNSSEYHEQQQRAQDSEQSHTPPTGKVRNPTIATPSTRNIRFVDGEQVIESPLRIPPPSGDNNAIPGEPSPSSVAFTGDTEITKGRLAMTDIQPLRRQLFTRTMLNTGLRQVGASTSGGAGGGVRRSLFPRKTVRGTVAAIQQQEQEDDRP